jgi:thiamine biosynthesis lipoprotein
MTLALVAAAAALARYEFSQPHMGVEVRVALYAASREQAERAGRAAFARIAELDAALSDWKPDSELNRLCDAADGEPRPASDDLVGVLRAARRFSALSDGAFDATAGPLVRLWREARRSAAMPDSETLARARALVGYRRCRVDAVRRTVALEPGTRLDLGGIAKGYACDRALEAISREGVGSALVAIAGDVAVSGPPPGQPGWKVSTPAPGLPVVVLRDSAVSTSGDTEQYVELGGVRYSHIVDPRTGLGCTERWQATVVARRGVTADALATALCVLGGPGAARLGPVFRAQCHVWQAHP